MQKLLPSRNSFVLTVKAEPEFVVEQFRKRMCEDNLLWMMMESAQFPMNGTYVGRIVGRNIEARYVWFLRNNAEPILSVQVEETGDGSVIKGQYSSSLIPTVLLILGWLVILTPVALLCIPSLLYGASPWMAFAVSIIVAVCLVRLFNRKSERELQKLLNAVIRGCEGAQSKEQ